MSYVESYDGITPELSAMAARMKNPTVLMKAAGNALRSILADHFLSRGGRFWPRFSSRTATMLQSYDSRQATVAVVGEYGPILMHKITGGVIRGKSPNRFGGIKKLAIPAMPEARMAGPPSHGNTPFLEVVFTRRGGKMRAYALAEAKDDLRKRQRKTIGRIWYWLVAETDFQKPDPNALPSKVYVESEILRRTATAIGPLLTGNR